MSKSPNTKDDAWYARIDCPRYFDFSAALQAPCSVDLEYNPPLHDFVYESDEESSDFFRRAQASPPSPHPKRTQQRMLDPRHFGNPIYRHRPHTTFEEFLRQYQQQRHAKQTKSHQPVFATSGNPLHDASPSSQTPLLSSQQFGPCKSPNNPEVLFDPNSFNKADTVIPREMDRSLTFKTPSGDSSIKTPASNRRRAQQYTPSRLRNPSHVVKSLFFTPSSPSPSPLRKARRNLQAPPPKSSDTPHQPLPSPLRLTPKNPHPNSEASAKISASSVNTSLRPPVRTTPPTNTESSISPADSNPPSKAVKISAPFVDRRDKRTPDALGLPRRTIRPFGSNISSSTVTPPTQNTDHNDTESASKSVAREGPPAAPSADNKNSDNAVPDDGQNPVPQSQRNNVNISFQVPEESKEERKDQAADAPEIDDPDLMRILKEHNRRLRKSGRHVPKDILDAIGEGESLTETPARIVDQGNDTKSKTSSNNDADPPATQAKSESAHKGKEGQSDFNKRSGRSLQDLLSSRNDRILQDRRKRLPERAKLINLNKEIVLQRMERPKAAPQERGSAKVDFTSSQPTFKQRARSVHSTIKLSADTSKKHDGNIATRIQQRRGKAIRGRSKVVMDDGNKNDQNGKRNVSIAQASTGSRFGRSKGVVEKSDKNGQNGKPNVPTAQASIGSQLGMSRGIVEDGDKNDRNGKRNASIAQASSDSRLGRSKVIVKDVDKNDENGTRNAPIAQASSSSRLRVKTASERIKADERDKRKQERMERDLNSLLSQHNSKVQSKRRGKA